MKRGSPSGLGSRSSFALVTEAPLAVSSQGLPSSSMRRQMTPDEPGCRAPAWAERSFGAGFGGPRGRQPRLGPAAGQREIVLGAVTRGGPAQLEWLVVVGAAHVRAAVLGQDEGVPERHREVLRARLVGRGQHGVEELHLL